MGPSNLPDGALLVCNASMVELWSVFAGGGDPFWRRSSVPFGVPFCFLIDMIRGGSTPDMTSGSVVFFALVLGATTLQSEGAVTKCHLKCDLKCYLKCFQGPTVALV